MKWLSIVVNEEGESSTGSLAQWKKGRRGEAGVAVEGMRIFIEFVGIIRYGDCTA